MTTISSMQVLCMILCTDSKQLIFTLFIVCCCSSSVVCSWDFLAHKDTTLIGSVLLNKKSASNHGVEHFVHRRSADVDDWLPSYLEFTFDVHGTTIPLRLRENTLDDTRAPVFVVHDGKIVQENLGRKNATRYGLYQDIDNGASVLVQRRSGSVFDVTGTYLHDGEEYLIQPIRGQVASDVDHKIAKLNINEAQLTHDMIDIGSTWPLNSDKDDNATNFIEVLEESYDSPLTESQPLNFHGNASKGNPEAHVDTVEQDGNTQETNLASDDDNIVDPVNRKLPDKNEIGGNAQIASTATRAEDEDDDDDTRVMDRVKRQAPKNYVVEMLIVVDYGVYEVWYNGVADLEGEAKREEAIKRIKQYYSFVINGVDLRYKSITKHVDYTIDVTWAGIIIFDSPVQDYWKNTEKPPTSSRDFVESSAALEAFRAWAESQGTDLPPSDHVMLFTGHNLTYGGSVSNAGLAYLGSACNPDYFYSIVEEYFEFRDVAIAAHELGHSLGARHDMDGNTCLSFDRYIMTSRFKFPSKRKAKNPWLFSSCSVEYFTDFIESLDRNDTNCLIVNDAKPGKENSQPILMSLPGETYAGDEFCKISEGFESYICRDQHISSYNNICYAGLYCYVPSEGKCVAKLPPNGMTCGNKKWCMNGTCVQSEMAPATSDECPFGDEPALIGGRTCAQRMLTSRYDCYRDTFRGKCCASCRRYRRNLPGCEYGDMFELCKKEQCTNYDEDYARDNCCDTCAELFYTIIPTTATTVETTVTTTTTTTSETTTESAGKGEENTGGGDGGKTSPSKGSNKGRGNEGENEKEEKGGGKSERNNKKDRSMRRRNDVESVESDESEYRYRTRSYNGRRNTRYRQRGQRRLNTLTNDRLVQIRSLLDEMKRARDNSRFQRMRFLMYVLDKTGYDGSEPFQGMSNLSKRKQKR